MIDINLYRFRIGSFRQRVKARKFLRKYESTTNRCSSLENTSRTAFTEYLKIILILLLLFSTSSGKQQNIHPWQITFPKQNFTNFKSTETTRLFSGFKEVGNFWARYIHGNKQTPSRGIMNMHLNIRSLGHKVFEIKNIVKQYHPHIIGLSECELKKHGGNYDESFLKIPGYNILFPKSWSSHGFARVVVYVKKTLEFEQISDLEDDLVQSIWLKGGFKNSKMMYFCHLYREHTSTLGNSIRAQKSNLMILLDQWEAATQHSNPVEPNETHICGDMNLDTLEGRWLKPDYPLISLSRLVQSACNLGNFHQLVNSPTRSQYNRAKNKTDISCIDHIYCNTKFRCSNAFVTSFGNSDHDIVGYTRFSKVPCSPARSVRKRSYKKFDKDKFLADLSSIHWDQVYMCQEVDQAESTFTRLFQSVLDVHAPWIQFQQRKNFAPWLTEQTKELMKQRHEWKLVAQKAAIENATNIATEREVHAWEQYKKLRNKVNNLKKYDEKTFKAGKINENLDSPEKTWNTAKKFMNWKQQGQPQQLQVGPLLVTKASLIASTMNEYFIDKVRLIRSGISSMAADLSACYKVMESKSCKLHFNHVTEEKVRKLLSKLKNTRSSAADGLDNYCVKVSADIIAGPLHHIISLSIMQNKFPTSWKFAKVVPLHKKDSVLERKNYRPVAILSPLGKIVEKIAYEQIYNHFSKNKIFHENLQGYRENRSTQTALLQMYDRWVRAAHAGRVTGVVLLDLSAAFDLVDHQLLLDKLGVYGVDKDFCQWICSYLSGRHQAVWIDHCFSPFLPSDVGVPQGSNLGPLFFLIFYNDLLFSLNCELDAYADDSTISASGADVEEIGNILTENCSIVSTWMMRNKLKLNAEKTHLITVGTSNRIAGLASEVQVEMNSIKLKESSARFEVLLGVSVEYNLKWHRTVDRLKMKLKSRIAGLSKLRFIVPFHTLKSITQGIFNSVLIYCLPLIGGLDKGQLGDLQVLQNKAAQIVTRSPPRSPRGVMYDKLDWLSVNQLLAYHTLIQIFKIRTSGEPEYLKRILSNDNRNGHILIPNSELTLARKSFCFRGAELWNRVPALVRSSSKIGRFKIQTRKWVKDCVPRFPD